MSTVDEVLATAEVVDAVCIIDGETRIISVPNEYKELGVESDEKVTRIKFQCPKIVGDNVDLTEYNLYINYRNASNKLNSYLVEDVTVTGDVINFSWLLSRHVTESPGTISYIVCAKKSDYTGVINEWNTKVATGTVGVGLEATEEIEEQNIDIIEQILRSIVELENKVDGGGGGGNSIAIDETLTEQGKAADAKATGDAIRSLSEEISTVPENVALLEDVTVDEASGDFIPMLSQNGTEYRLSIGDDGIPVIKNLSGATVWSGTSGGSSGGDAGGDNTGSDTPAGEWQSGAEVAYTLVDGEWAKEDGSFVPYDGWSRTDFIYCYGAGHIYHSCSGANTISIVFYDINKKFVSKQSGYVDWNAIPENAVYVVMTFTTERMTGSVIKLYKKVEPTWTDGEAYEFTFVENEYINAGNGQPTAYNGWKRTDYVNCAGATKITKTNASGMSQYGGFYNAEKEYLTGMKTPDTTEGTSADITVPVGACYFVTSDSNANMDALVLIPYA